MADHILYSEVDKKFWFHQPNLIRWRHRWRSPRESLKVNQEIGAYHYDIARLNQRRKETDATIGEMIENLTYGWDMDNNVSFDWHSDDEPSEQPASLIGLEEMATRIERLRSRIRYLEI